MRAALILTCVICAAPLFAAEAWFLPYEPDEHTIALFHFDEEADQQPNAAGTDLQATLVKGATIGEGIFGSGVRLDGPKQCIRFGDSERLSFGNAQPFTIEGWIHPDSAEGSIFSIGTRFYLQANFSRGTASFGYRAASFPIRWFPMSGVPWQRNRWQHFALTHDAERVARLYLNGVEVANTSHADEGDYEGNPSGVFGAHDGWTKFLVGAVDEMRVSDIVRTFQPLLTQSSRC